MSNSKLTKVVNSECSRLISQIDEYLGNELTPFVTRTYDLHLVMCKSCNSAVQETKQLLAVARTLRDIPIPDGVHARLMKAISDRAGLGGDKTEILCE